MIKQLKRLKAYLKSYDRNLKPMQKKHWIFNIYTHLFSLFCRTSVTNISNNFVSHFSKQSFKVFHNLIKVTHKYTYPNIIPAYALPHTQIDVNQGWGKD